MTCAIVPSAVEQRRTRSFVWMGTFLCCLGPLGAGAEERVVGATSYLRDGPGIRYRTIDEAGGGRRVGVIECAEGWCRVRLGDATGYLAEQALARPGRDGPVGAGRSCYVYGQAGYHGLRDVQICHPASP